MKLEVINGKGGWFWHLRFKSKIMCVSESYARQGNALRAANRMAALMNEAVPVVLVGE